VTKRLLAVFVLLIASLVAISPPADAGEQSRAKECARRASNTTSKIMRCVQVENVREHQKAFQKAADENGGNRAAGTPGYDQSAEYVYRELEEAGYSPVRQFFDFSFFQLLGPSSFEQASPNPTSYVDQTDYDVMTFSGSGDTGTVDITPVDLSLDDRDASTSGCEAEDFDGFPAGTIALTQRGACSFAQKAQNAEDAEAVGLIVFNQGNTPDREGLLFGTLGGPGSNIPVVGTTFAVGDALSKGATGSLVVDALSETRTTYNVLAETRGGRDDRVIMVGGHLDSVPEGPGVQDNGTGSAAILEVAIQMRKVNPRNKVRFAWWGAEEFGLLGSDYYITDLFFNDPETLDGIALYLNFDMVGSPNYAFFVYDGDGDAFGLVGPPGSDHIEATFEKFYKKQKQKSEPTAFSGRSDYAAFIQPGVEIPAGGLFTGAEGIKTPEQVAKFGGTAGEQYDPCYHIACDTFDNISMKALDINSDAIGYATITYAQAKNIFDQKPKKRSSGAGSLSGGGLHSHEDLE